MLFKSIIHFNGSGGVIPFRKGSGRLCIGDQPRLQPLKELDVAADPVFVAFFPTVVGLLDDHVESWFLTYSQEPRCQPEGMESVVGLGLGQEWPPPPADLPDCEEMAAR
jgi:hypothetical protein